jgi:hypothetical protein
MRDRQKADHGSAGLLLANAGKQRVEGQSIIAPWETVTTSEGKAYVFVAVEHANSEIVGIHAALSANRFEALEPVRQGVHRCFGSIAPGVARGLKLRHDHGSNYMSRDFQDEIACLGIEGSPYANSKAMASPSASSGP